MKFQWKLVLGILIGALAMGQIAAIHYVLAAKSADMGAAQAEAQSAASALATAQKAHATQKQIMDKMSSMPMSDTEKEMYEAMKQQWTTQDALINCQIHSQNAINHIWAHIDKSQ